jgi:hypothetical protein
LDSATRDRILEYVRPLAVGLDGLTNHGDVERAVAAAQRIAGSRSDVDPDVLFLLAVFSGQEKWVSRMGHRSRTELFLGSLGVGAKVIAGLFRSLARFDSDPRTAEEEVVHDAVRLDRLGAYGISRGLVEGYRERLDFLEAADQIDEAAAVAMRTAEAEALAAPRRRVMREFAGRLRAEVQEFATR